MAILAYDDVMLREPRLLVPGMQPLGAIRVNTENPLGLTIQDFTTLYFSCGSEKDFVLGRTWSVQGTTPRYLATENFHGRYYRLSGNYIVSDSTCAPSSGLSCTFISQFVVKALTAYATPLQIAPNTNVSVYSGIHLFIATTGKLVVQIGTGGGGGPSNRKSWETADGTISAHIPYTIVASIRGLTDATFALNGKIIPWVNGTGTASTCVMGAAPAHIGRGVGTGSIVYGDIAVGVSGLINKPLSDTHVQALSADPYMLFSPA